MQDVLGGFEPCQDVAFVLRLNQLAQVRQELGDSFVIQTLQELPVSESVRGDFHDNLGVLVHVESIDHRLDVSLFPKVLDDRDIIDSLRDHLDD
jgi:hypothetical protein